MKRTPRLLNHNFPCDTCKYYGDKHLCVGSCEGCDNMGKDLCHCIEFVSVEETVCPYYKENRVSSDKS